LTGTSKRRVTPYIRLLTDTKPTGTMDGDESALSQLGKSQPLFGGANTEKIAELEERIVELERRIMLMQGETIGSIEAMQRRLQNIEENRRSDSVLDFISPDELNDIAGTKIGVWPDKEDYVDDGEEVTVVESGFTFGIAEEVEEELEVPNETKTHEDYAKGIIDYIEEHGGVANAEWKKKNLIPEEYEYEDRVKVRGLVNATEGITYWKRNRMWWFYYKEEEGLEASHERVYGTAP